MSFECTFCIGQGNDKNGKRKALSGMTEAEVGKNNHRYPQEVLLWPLGVAGFMWLSLYPEKTNGQIPFHLPSLPYELWAYRRKPGTIR